jgi:hypothetical protein
MRHQLKLLLMPVTAAVCQKGSVPTTRKFKPGPVRMWMLPSARMRVTGVPRTGSSQAVTDAAVDAAAGDGAMVAIADAAMSAAISPVMVRDFMMSLLENFKGFIGNYEPSGEICNSP